MEEELKGKEKVGEKHCKDIGGNSRPLWWSMVSNHIYQNHEQYHYHTFPNFNSNWKWELEKYITLFIFHIA